MLRPVKSPVSVLSAVEVALPTEYAVPAAVLIARISCVNETRLPIVETWVEMTVLRPTTLEPRTLRAVDAPVAMPRAVDAVVETPGMPAVRRATALIVETWVLTTLLKPIKEAVMVLSPVEFVVARTIALPPTVDALYATPRAVEAVVLMPGIEAVRSATALIVDTCVETTLLSDVKEVVRLPAVVDAPVAIPRAVEAVVLMPGMPAVRSATALIVDT